ncbi:MAG: hypothetical protein AB1798_23420, partial [Spirochaetota bacterium]
MNNNPLIDKRSWKDIVNQARAFASIYTPEWASQDDDPGLVIIYLFSRLMEIVIDRLNRVPDKHFLAFLDVAGVTLLAPKAARAPVKFILSAGAKDDGFVPQGTQLANSPPPGQESVTFETEKSLVMSTSRLKKL